MTHGKKNDNKKQDLQAMCSNSNTAKEEKLKTSLFLSDIFKETITICQYDMSAPIHHFEVLFEINLSFTSLLCTLCSIGKLAFF